MMSGVGVPGTKSQSRLAQAHDTLIKIKELY